MIRVQNKLDKFENTAISLFYFILRSALSFGVGYITAKCTVLEDFSPFSIILLSVSPKIGLVPTFCYLGSSLGHLTNPFDLTIFKYITALTMIFTVYMVFQKTMHIIKSDTAVLSAGCCLVSGFFFMLAGNMTLFSVLLLICESILICCCIYFVNYAAKAFKKCCYLSSRELIAVSVTLILILISLQNISLFNINISRLLSISILFLALNCLKTSHTAVLGCCLGIISAAVANGGETIFTAMIVGTLAGCVFSAFSNRLAMTSFIIAYYAVLFFFGKFPWSYWYFSEPPIAMVLVFFIPKEQLRKFLSSYITVKSPDGSTIEPKTNIGQDIEALVDQFNQISKSIETKMNDTLSPVHFFIEEEKNIRKELENRKVNVRDINFIEDEQRCKKCDITFSVDDDILCEEIIKEAVSPYFSTGFTLKVAEQSGNYWAHIKEKSNYIISCAALCKNKSGEPVSGDNAFGFSINKDTYCLILADGMGSGNEAGYESKLVIDTLKKLLIGGMTVQNALNIYRSSERFREEERFTTIDICMIDLKDGVADFYKAGSYDSFFIHKDKLSVLRGGGMPLGLSENDRVKHQSIRISDGDFLIMGSDGLTAFDKQTDAMILLCKHDNVKTYTQNILKRIFEINGNRCDDDITIIAAKFQKNAE